MTVYIVYRWQTASFPLVKLLFPCLKNVTCCDVCICVCVCPCVCVSVCVRVCVSPCVRVSMRVCVRVSVCATWPVYFPYCQCASLNVEDLLQLPTAKIKSKLKWTATSPYDHTLTKKSEKNPAYGQHSALSYVSDSRVRILYHASKSIQWVLHEFYIIFFQKLIGSLIYMPNYLGKKN